MAKQRTIKNEYEDKSLQIDQKYLKYMPIPLEGAIQDVAAALRTRDLGAIEAALIPVAQTATNFMYVLGMACLVIEEQRLYEGTEFGWSYLRYAEHLVEELNIPIATISEAKVLMEIYRDYFTPLKKAGFKIEKNASKLRYLPEALENHRAEEVYKKIVEDTFREFRDWAQKKVLPRQVISAPETRVDVTINGNKLLVRGKNILNFPKNLDNDTKTMITEDLKRTFSIRDGGNIPFIVETYDIGEQTAISNYLKKLRVKK
ncbi:hypothetical protein FACS1894151_10880 [Spirochaetia bacterium]|nr:hypothetical protein FACS1894151_10880 [Spirochaetia bacterium]